MAKAGPKVVTNPTGYRCINLLVQRAIGKVKEKARTRNRAAAWYAKNKSRAAASQKQRHEINKEKDNNRSMRYYNEHKPSVLKTMKVYRDEHKGERAAYTKERRANDPVFQLTERCRSALSRFVHRDFGAKEDSARHLLKCSYEELHAHISRQVAGRDTGDIQLDHIFPFAAFRDQLKNAQLKLMHYSNIQPLTTAENASKRAKLPTKAMAAKVDPACWPDGVTMDMLPDIYPGWATPLRMHA